MSDAKEIRAALDANRAFYSAFAAGDVDAMEALWATSAPVLCVHPGAPALHGRDAVMQSWAQILEDPPPIAYSTAQVSLVRGIAFVTCLEHIGDGTLAASNVFVWEDGTFRLVHHQAGALLALDPESPPPDGQIH